jgi:alpha-tubulin suppressor-like RCC1 family protein
MKNFLMVGMILSMGSACFAGTPQNITFPEIGMKAATDPAFALNATASSGLPVIYTITAGGSVATVSGNMVTLSGTTGPVTIKASQAGDGTFESAPDLYASFFVQSADMADWQSVSAGESHTVAVRSDGTLWAMGRNDNGQLGDGTTVRRSRLVQIGPDTHWSFVTAGWRHTLALKTDGTLWAWGYNVGQLGDGTSTERWSPVQIGSSTNWRSVASGNSRTIAVKTDGTLWAWGFGNKSPAQVGSATDWHSVASGYSHALALKNDGTLWAWGANDQGQLGDGTTTPQTVPVQIASGIHWKAVAAGFSHSVGVATDGTLWTWGDNASGQLGDGTNTDRLNPTQIGSMTDWSGVAAGYYHTFALKTDATLWACGFNVSQLGDGTRTDRNSFVPVGTGAYGGVAAGKYHSLAVKTDGTFWVWGSHDGMQIDYGFRGFSPIFPELEAVTACAAGSGHMVVVTKSGSLWAWGSNSLGQIGDGTTIDRSSPVQIGFDTNWKTVGTGSGYTVALKNDGTLWTWGSNFHGQLGDGTTTQRSIPAQVGSSIQWKSAAAGLLHTVAVATDGTLWAWGWNDEGQLGDGTTMQRTTPVQIGSYNHWKCVAAGYNHTLALKTDNTLWAWGSNNTGKVGDGTTTRRTSPVRIGTASDWQSIATGAFHSLAIKNEGSLWAWGTNDKGQLGTGSAAFVQTSPEQVGTALDWKSVVGGYSHTVGIKMDGTLWTWGWNGYGQLGDGTGMDRNVPAQVGTAAGWDALPEGGMMMAYYTLARSAEGTLWGFGDNYYGELSDAAPDKRLPVRFLPALVPQTLDFPEVATNIGVPVPLSATAASGRPVTYSVSGPAVLSGNQLTVTGGGAVHLIAYQKGGDVWAGSGPVLANLSISSSFTPSFGSAGDVPLIVGEFIATGLMLNPSLTFDPVVGTVLTVVNNTGSGPISGTFGNVTEGGTVAVTHDDAVYYFTVSYTGGTGNDIALTLAAVSPITYSKWATIIDWNEAEDSDAEADPNGNGTANLLEFVLNTDPLGVGSMPQTVLDAEENVLTLTYRKRKSIQGVNLMVQSSADLVTWTDESGLIPELVSGEGDIVTEVWSVQKPVGLRLKLFLRLKATVP